MTHWGKAGVRLTEDEIRRRDNHRRLQAAFSRERHEHEDRIALQLWAAGQVKPYRITMVLDGKGLYGPEVDIACGAQEPDVDLWEAGERYPTWEQVKALARLCGVTPRFLCEPGPPIPVAATSLRFHLPPEPEPPIIWAFKPAAVAATVGIS